MGKKMSARKNASRVPPPSPSASDDEGDHLAGISKVFSDPSPKKGKSSSKSLEDPQIGTDSVKRKKEKSVPSSSRTLRSKFSHALPFSSHSNPLDLDEEQEDVPIEKEESLKTHAKESEAAEGLKTLGQESHPSSKKSVKRTTRPSTGNSSESDQEEPSLKKSKLAGYDLSSPTLSHAFYDSDAKRMYECVSSRIILCEKLIDPESYKLLGILGLIESAGLMGSVTVFKGYVAEIIHEFYANMKPEICDPNSAFYQSIYLRGHVYIFSPEKIAEAIGCICHASSRKKELDFGVSISDIVSEITDGEIQSWPKPYLNASSLIPKYAILHKIASFNWVPTNHISTVSKDLAAFLYAVGKGIKINFGKFVFDCVTSLAGLPREIGPLIFPCIIYAVLKAQRPLRDDLELFVEPKVIQVSPKLRKEAAKPRVKKSLLDKEVPDLPPSASLEEDYLKSDLLLCRQMKEMQQIRLKTYEADIRALEFKETFFMSVLQKLHSVDTGVGPSSAAAAEESSSSE